MRYVVVFLTICVVTLAIVAYSQRVGLHLQQQEIKSLSARLATTQQPVIVSLDVQAKCAKQARTEFIAEGENKRQLAEYTQHYSLKQRKCFVEIRDTDAKPASGTIYVNDQVLDAFERKVYAMYLWRGEKAERFWEVPPLQCKVAMITREEKECHSRMEFDTLVKQYMDDDSSLIIRSDKASHHLQ